MKKLFLFLFVALLTLGVSQVVAQPYLPPTPIGDCIDLTNPLNVVAGQPYTYEVNVPTPPGNKTYHWYVTQDTQFIEAGGLNLTNVQAADGTILASSVGNYNDPTNTVESISLTFQTFSLAADQYVFVVVYVVNDGVVAGEGCITDNLKVYRIQPIHAFTLTIANIDGTAIDTGTTEVCVDDVQSAVFDINHGTNGGVVYDFGQNEFYFAVAAANFSGKFQLAATLTGLQAGTPGGTAAQTATIYWGTVLADVQLAAAGGVAITAGETIVGEITTAAGTSYGEGQVATDANAAYMIYLKVVLDHNQFEANDAAGYLYTLAIDGVLPNNLGTYGPHDNTNDLGDLAQGQISATNTCVREAFGTHNRAVQKLMPRPNVDSVPAGILLPNAP